MQDLDRKCVVAKFIPWFLLPEKKDMVLQMLMTLIQITANEPYFLKVIAEDEACVYGYDLETKAQSSQWKSPGSPCSKKVRQSPSKMKTMITVFFDWEGVVYHEHALPGQKINKEYYLNVLCWLRDSIQQRWPQLWATDDWQLHQDNVPTHASHVVQRFLVKITQVTQPLYSPNLASRDFWLFPKLKSPLKGKKFQTINDSGKYNGAADGNSNKRFCSVLNSGRDAGGTV